jgi:tetratricopeptide (TPR) repeat protein
VVWPVGAAIVVALVLLTERRIAVFHDSLSLWQDVVAKDSASVIGHISLGSARLQHGDASEARRQIGLALKLDPGSPDAWIAQSQVDAGNMPRAIADLRQARRVAPDNPLGPYYLAGLLAADGQRAEAIVLYHTAARMLGNPAPAYNDAGELELREGDISSAVADFDAAVAADPDLASAHNNLAGIALSEGGSDATEAAIEQCQAALASEPDDSGACNNMGVALVREGEYAQAIQWFQKAVKIDPNFASARSNLERMTKVSTP